jgi:hypothetical protein
LNSEKVILVAGLHFRVYPACAHAAERQHGHGAKADIFPQPAQAESQVLQA